MKGKKCIKFLTFFITLALFFVLFSNDTRAYNYQDVSWKDCTAGSIHWNNGASINIPKVNNNCSLSASGYTNTSGFGYLSINFNGTISGGSLATIFIRVRSPIDGGYPQIGWGARSGAYTVVDTTFGEYGLTAVTLYFDQSISGSVDLTPTGIVNFNSIDIKISPIYLVFLRAEPTRQQISDITAILNTLNENIDLLVDNKIESVITILNSLASDSDRTADAVEEQNEKDDQDRQDIESQSSNTDTEANEQGDEATQTGTSLFSAFTQLLGALTNVNGNTCTLPEMQVYTLNMGNLNLCQYDIPPQIMALVSIGMVFIIVPLGINLVKRMISLYKEITG